MNSAPGAGLSRRPALTIRTRPTAISHYAPFADAIRQIVGVVQVRQPKTVPQFMDVHPDCHIAGRQPELRLHRVGGNVNPVLIPRHNTPLVRPDIVVATTVLSSGAAVDYQQRVNVSVTIVIIVGKVHKWINLVNQVFHQFLGVLRVGAGSVLTVDVPGVCQGGSAPVQRRREVYRNHI